MKDVRFSSMEKGVVELKTIHMKKRNMCKAMILKGHSTIKTKINNIYNLCGISVLAGTREHA